jgi:hypothetical protein
MPFRNKQYIERMAVLFSFIYKKEFSRDGTGTVHWRKKQKKKVWIEYYFFRARANDDRPVSVPVGSCCLELFDADWTSLEVRRYTPKIPKNKINKEN